MYILGINFSHDSSICLLKDGEILFYLEEERLSHEKHCMYIDKVIDQILKYTPYVDVICYTCDTGNKKIPLLVHGDPDIETTVDKNKTRINNIDGYNLISYGYNFKNDIHYSRLQKVMKQGHTVLQMRLNQHHLTHAHHAFYNSGFEEAVCIVVDGMGSITKENYGEVESIYQLSYPAVSKEIYKKYKKVDDANDIGIGWLYTNTAIELGFGVYESGKVMGMMSYYDKEYNTPLGIDADKFNTDVKSAYLAQSWTEHKVYELIMKSIIQTGCKNVCLSGGYGMNCVANYSFIKQLPKDVKFYVEPISLDAGHSVGLAKWFWHELTGDTTIRPQTSLYLGSDPEY